MLEVDNLRKDADFSTKASILSQLQKEGFIDQIRAQLRSQVIQALEKEKKAQYGSASKYLQKSELSNPITRKVIENEDGLICAEIIREFLSFYKMNLSLQVFEPEMSLGYAFPKRRSEIEREVGLAERGDSSKPLLLKLVEQIKYGANQQASNVSQKRDGAFEKPELINSQTNAAAVVNEEKKEEPKKKKSSASKKKEGKTKKGMKEEQKQQAIE